jgi:hypothetical protein
MMAAMISTRVEDLRASKDQPPAGLRCLARPCAGACIDHTTKPRRDNVNAGA